MRFKIFFQAIVLVVSCLSCLTANIITLGQYKEPIKIQVHSSNPQILLIAENAFNLHGAFKTVSKKPDHLILELNPLPNNQINLKIQSPSTKKILFEQSFHESSFFDSTLKACDAVLEKLGFKPFFSSKIAFVSKKSNSRELFISDILLHEPHQITNDSADLISPKFSPDGKRILYTSYYKTGSPDIFELDLSTKHRKTIAAYNGINMGAVFSPDDSHIAMVLSSNGNPELFISQKSGKNLRRLTSSSALESTPAWSNDSQFLYFSSDQTGAPQLYKINTSTKEITYLKTKISKYCAEPAPNPIFNKLIAFTAATKKSFQIAIYDESSGKADFITSDADDFTEPSWLPDGRHLLVTHRKNNIQSLCVLDSISGKYTPIKHLDLTQTMMATSSYKK